MKLYNFSKILRFIGVSLFCGIVFTGVAQAEDISKLIVEGESVFARKDFAKAEQIFSKADSLDPGNYRILKRLAESKVGQGKYAEADPILDRILAMPVSTGRDVLVFLDGKNKGRPAELVDETVVTPESGQNNMRNYVDLERKAPIPHYRFFFKDTGKMKLVPKYKAKVKYEGVLSRVYFMVKETSAKVKKKIIDAKPDSGDPMVTIKAGCFNMGSEKGDSDERPIHEVCLAKFELGQYEVSQKAFQEVMGSNPSLNLGANYPVDSVTWFEANEYCQRTGRRLPSEAEWEYAARAGTNTVFYWGDKIDIQYANFCDKRCKLNDKVASLDDGYAHTAPIGTFKPNAFDLYEMIGNVSEWVEDFMQENYYQISPKHNPEGPEMQKVRKIFRGGAWNMRPSELRASNRSSIVMNYRPESMGFRCAK